MNTSVRIGIDGRPLQGLRSGVGRYVFELCRGLDALMPEATFFVYSNTPVELPVLGPRWVLRLEPSRYFRKLKSVMWIKLRCHLLCNQDDLDFYWGGASFLPNLSGSVKTVLTVHDLNHIICPSSMGTTHYWAHKLFFSRDVKRADIVVANSHGTATRLAQHGYRTPDAVVTPAVSCDFFPQPQEVVFACKAKYSIDTPYILAVATWEPRKNLELLIHTFMKMKAKGLLPDYKLVLAGGKGWKDQRLIDLLGQVGREYVLPLGFVSNEDLRALYTGTAAFIFPSQYEGYGIPVIEALACSAPTVASDIPEIREAGQDEVIYAPVDEEGIKAGIMKALAQPRRPGASTNLPTWEKEAMKLASLFKK